MNRTDPEIQALLQVARTSRELLRVLVEEDRSDVYSTERARAREGLMKRLDRYLKETNH